MCFKEFEKSLFHFKQKNDLKRDAKSSLDLHVSPVWNMGYTGKGIGKYNKCLEAFQI